MNTKKIILTIILFINIIALAVVIFFITKKEEVPAIEQAGIPVKVEEIVNTDKDSNLQYTGLLQNKTTEQVSFSSLQEIEKIYVSEGDRVKRGDKLVQIDSQDSYDAYKESKERLNDAEDELDDAQDDYRDVLNDPTSTQIEIDAAKQRVETAEDNVELREEAYDNALQAYEDTTYYAKNDGIVLKINSTEGSVTNPIVPVMVIGSDDLVIQFGVSFEDYPLIKKNQTVDVTINGDNYRGHVSSIDAAPDTETRTYLVDVSFNEDLSKYPIASIGKVTVNVGKIEGIWLPIFSILNDGQDFVYIVDDSRVRRKNVNIIDISNDYVRVSGLDEFDKVIIQGMKSVKSGDLVEIVE